MKRFKCLVENIGYPYCKKGEIYNEDFMTGDIYSVLEMVEDFPDDWQEEKEEKEKTFPRKMLVWDWRERAAKEELVFGIFPERSTAYKVIGVSTVWQHAKELLETEEMTLEQVCKELGRDIKIVKG